MNDKLKQEITEMIETFLNGNKKVAMKMFRGLAGDDRKKVLSLLMEDVYFKGEEYGTNSMVCSFLLECIKHIY